VHIWKEVITELDDHYDSALLKGNDNKKADIVIEN
jgi:hypothetical protein